MLFPDVPHWNLLAFAVGDCDTEDALTQEDFLGIHAERRVMPSQMQPDGTEV
jgi:hypothetical protein